MNRIPLKAEERDLLGKKVKQLRRDGIIPAHVYGNKVETEHVSVYAKDLMPVIHQAGETGVIDLQIGAERVRPVMVRGIQHDPNKGEILHVDFYQVNLKQKVTVPVPLILKELEEEIELVKMGEAVVLQTLSEVQVEALPTDLIDNIEVDIRSLKNVDDAITVSQLSYNHETITVLAEPEEVVVKLAPAITEEMQKLMEEQAAEAAAAEQAAEGAEGAEGEEKVEGEEGESGEVEEGGEVTESTEEKSESTEEKS